MKLNEIEIGDRVRCTDTFEGVVMAGEEGEVIQVLSGGHILPVGVKWDTYCNNKHDLLGLCERGYGYWVHPGTIELISVLPAINEEELFDILQNY